MLKRARAEYAKLQWARRLDPRVQNLLRRMKFPP